MKTLFTLALTLSTTIAHADMQASHLSFDMTVPHHKTAMSGAIWYPTEERGAETLYGDNPVFHGTPVQTNSILADGTFPVVLVSHGLGGNIRTLGWLTAGLAARGAIVVSVNHPNSTTGDLDMLTGLNHGTRAQDMSRALDALLADPMFAGQIDADRILATGFSYGGWTALSLGGVTGNLAGYANHCDEAGTGSTHCRDIARGGIDLRDLDVAAWNASYKDDRITAVAAIDPGLHYGLEAHNIANSVSDVSLIALGTGAHRLFATDFSGNGSWFSDLMPDASIVTIEHASHFSALLTCKPMGAVILREEGDDPVCDDVAGSTRTEVHAEILTAISDQIGL